ncbi:MAG: alpha-L-fucosidase, partial [Cyclobacteriaceae bacterium]
MEINKYFLNYSIIFLIITAGLFSCNPTSSENNTIAETVSEPDDRLAWFHEAKFGLFIHWGLYAVPAGEWEGETGHGEWIQYSANIPGKEYEKFATQFNPVKFNAEEWVSMAKNAGMKYIVITTKHHEGFCMYDSELTDYDIINATPYGKDPMKALAAECEKQGI